MFLVLKEAFEKHDADKSGAIDRTGIFYSIHF
jgi:Ca2+-binding EF-hand superfamily protein